MTSPLPSPTSFAATLQSRSMGAKFFLIVVLAFFMSIPGLFMSALTDNRAEAHAAVSTQAPNGAEIPPHTLLGVRLADSYRSTQRSLKYITLFLGLVFLTYFLFEVSTGRRVHPGQYALVGVAQTVFYLLLLSLAEHVGFDWAFLMAGAATVLLLSLNAEWVFRSRSRGIQASLVFTLLYSFIYVLLRLEQYALLIGSFTSFAAVAATMYLTRNVDWYSTTSTPATASASTRESWMD